MLSPDRPDRSGKVQAVLAKHYGDITSQIEVAGIIQSHLSKKGDIRRIALKRLDLSSASAVIDLGCGTGFFTEGLKGMVHPKVRVTGIDVHDSYRDYFLDTCRKCGFKGDFDGRGIGMIGELPVRSVDLVISSYSLYFFPEYIPRMGGLLKERGHFVAITHAVPHMIELTTYFKEVLRQEGIDYHHELPYESLIRNFSDENGIELLAPCFRDVWKYKCKSTLVFRDGEIQSLLAYLRHKEDFFLPPNDHNRKEVVEVIASRIEKEMKHHGQFSITKDDFIFVCSRPIHKFLKQ